MWPAGRGIPRSALEIRKSVYIAGKEILDSRRIRKQELRMKVAAVVGSHQSHRALDFLPCHCLKNQENTDDIKRI